MTTPNELLTKKLPDVVNAAVAEMKSMGDQGDADAKQRYADLASHPGAGRIVLEGKGGVDVYLTSEGAQFRADKQAPNVPVLLAIAVAAEAGEVALDEAGEGLEKTLGWLRKRLVRLSPSKTRAALDRLAAERLSFHIVIKDTPDFEEVRIKVATGVAEPPATPKFTATVDWNTLEQLRARTLKPQALLSKLKLSGDSARAMQLVMELAQRRG